MDSKKPHRITEVMRGVIVDKYELEGDLPDIIQRLQSKLEAAEELGYSDVRIETGESWQFGELEVTITLYGPRLETEKEIKVRREHTRSSATRAANAAAIKKSESPTSLPARETFNKDGGGC